MSLKGKVALVTGGSRGIGKAIVLKLAQEGANVAIIYASNEADAIATCKETENIGVKAKIYKCDVSEFEIVKETVKNIVADFGGIDILVNNAGIIRDELVFSMTSEDYDDVLDTNLKGAFNTIKCCYYGFIRRRSGKIINISSVSGIFGNAGQANYSAAKAGIIGLTKSIAKELAERNICCNAVAPGLIDTEMIESIKGDRRRLDLELIPLKRVGKPEDVANVVVFLAGSQSDYITGEVIRVDGGMAM
ncbi:3-oxoacyl-[acyl-carrier-protein] reductase [Paenibacillus apiarius]|uniref:3-oxoacyl-[acyl-carrier-protein] reductase n=1 Tax=Paenibacillus apiarius TaxID=46240 RepID=UPI00197CDC89|nr:3-oxoacyl-[acyl-carrier-protein] reductase [Paenibacillus apiarius]MBN3526390.1 3-oxoacyl-[acyl-carrier-protein] reductase [Paenibacillus apiarius]